MTTKIYRSRIHNRLTITGSFNSRPVTIRFIDGNGMAKCVYHTSDATEQQFIEQTELFRRNLLYLEKTINTQDKTPAEEEIKEADNLKQEIKEDDKATRTYTNRQDLSEQIKRLFPEEHVVVKTSETELLAIADKHNIIFKRI